MPDLRATIAGTLLTPMDLGATSWILEKLEQDGNTVSPSVKVSHHNYDCPTVTLNDMIVPKKLHTYL